MKVARPLRFLTEAERTRHEQACAKSNAIVALQRIRNNMAAIHTVNLHIVFGADFAAIVNALAHLPDMPETPADER